MQPLPEMWELPLRMGWSVVPIRSREKRPAIGWTRYQQRAADRSTVAAWAASFGNVGIVTGAFSRLFVLDLDHAQAIAEAEAKGLPRTVAVATGKGRHCYFRHLGEPIANRAGLFPGADIRGDGGCVVAPGSIHPSGSRYEWLASPVDTPLAAAPAWLVDLLRAAAPAKPSQDWPEARRRPLASLEGECTAYGRAALQRESEAIRRAVQGEQETTLNNAALKIGALVAGNELSLPFARIELVRAGMCMPNHNPRRLWTLAGVAAKVDRALADGAACPRSAPERAGVHHG